MHAERFQLFIFWMHFALLCYSLNLSQWFIQVFIWIHLFIVIITPVVSSILYIQMSLIICRLNSFHLSLIWYRHSSHMFNNFWCLFFFLHLSMCLQNSSMTTSSIARSYSKIDFRFTVFSNLQIQFILLITIIVATIHCIELFLFIFSVHFTQ